MSKRFATHLTFAAVMMAAAATLSVASACNLSDVYEYFQAISGPAAAESIVPSPVERPRNNPNLLVGLSGIYNIPGDFPDLATAITSLNANGVAGPVTLNVTASQTSPANSGSTGGGYIIGGPGSLVLTTTSVANTITIQGNGNTVTAPSNLIASQLNDAIFKLVGSDWVTITGFTMQENSANTTTIAGSNNMTEWGVALMYVTTIDGAQNDTIQNNTITLNRTYANTFGIYANATHNTTAVTSTNSATGAAGGNSGLKVYGNSISNVNMGVVVVGPQAASDVNTNVDIGGAGGVQANSITNFGTTGTFSGYANVSGTVNGILVRNTNGFNVSYNTITSSAGGTTSGTLNGIQIPVPTNAPIGTFTNSINNNAISLLSGATNALNGISIPTSSGSNTSTLNVNGNNFTGFGYLTDGVSAVNFITNSSNYQTQSISNNTFTNNAVNTSGTVILITNGTSLPTGGTKNVNGNSIVGTFSKPVAGGILTLFTDSGTDAAGTSNNTNNNNFSNITVTGATTLNGILNSNASPNKSVSNNTISSITAGSNAVQAVSATLDTGTTAVSGNTVSGLSVAGGAVTGIVCGSGTGASTLNCTQNTIQGLSSAGGAIVGMSVVGATTGSTRNIFKNKVYNDQSTTGSNYGIQVLSATTVNLYNNLIGDLRVPQGNTDDLIRGISANSTTSSSNVNVSYNTVYLSASSTGATFGSSAIFHSANSTSTTGTLNLRNNILVNNSTQNGAGIAAVYRRSNTPLNNFGSVSNNNLFFISTPGTSRYFFYNSSVGDTSLSAYKARVTPADSASVTENPAFVSTNGGDATFLHISTAMITQIESGGIPIAGITDDFDGDSRNASTPDIGADEFVGAGSDNTPPGISYTTLSDTSSLLNPTLGVSMTDATGVATGANLPRIYFKKSTDGAYSSSQCSFSSGNAQNGTYLCTINYALVGGGSVSAGNTVQYFVAAQDTLGNFTTNPIGGTGNVNAVTFGGTPNTYVIRPLISGSKNVGAGGDYPTITAALTALTNADLGGPLTLTLTDASYGSETFPLTVNANPGSSATNTITIKPASGINVSITGNNTGCILNLSGADWVTVDGSNNGTTSRNLTLGNTSTNSNSAVVCLNSLGAGQGAANDTVKNVNIVGFGTTATPATLFGIYAGAGTIGKSAAGPDNDNNTYQNNNITKTSIGIYTGGESAANKNTGTVIKQNVMNSASPNNLTEGGILVRFDDGALITENDISVLRNDGTVSASGLTNTAFGIALGLVPSNTVTTFTGSDVTNASITRNRINGVVQLYNDSTPDGFSAFGIVLNTVTSGTSLIANNMISGVRSAATVSDFSAGIVAGGGSGSTTQIYFNSVSMTGSRLGGDYPSYALAIGGSDPVVDVRDNIFLNTQTGGSGKNYAIGTASSTFTNLTSDFNDLFTSGANTFVGQTGGLGVTGTDRATFANWTAATGKDASSLNADPLFMSATDLHLQAGSPDIDTGTAIAGIATDYDGNVRPVGAAVDRGADEVGGTPGISVTGGPLNFGNQLVGTTSGDMSLTVTNTGTGDLVMGVATLTTGASQYVITMNPSGTVVPPGQTATVSIAFKPTTRGIKAGTVTINSNAPVTAPQVSLSGTGVAPMIGLSTGSLSFGSQTVGTTSAAMALTISNNGDTGQNLSISSLSITGTNPGDFNITDAPTLPASVAPLGSLTIHLTFTPAAGGARGASLAVASDDPITPSGSVTLSGTGATNLPPTLGPGPFFFTTINEDDTTNAGQLISAFIASTPAGTFGDGNGAGQPQGLVVISANNTNGAWQFSIDNGGNWMAFGTPTASAARLLASDANTRLRFVPNADYNGTSSITFLAWDQSSGTNGGTANTAGNGVGTSAFSGTSAIGQITVTAVNDAPVLDAARTPVLAAELEDSPTPTGAVGTLVSSLVDFAVPAGQVDNVTDVDAVAFLGVAVTGASTTSGTWFYSIDNGANWAPLGVVSDSNARLLAADANTRLYFQPNANFNGTIAAAITFRAWDQTSGTNGSLGSATTNGGTTSFSTATDTVNITITGVNDAPMATNLSAAETYTEDTSLNLIDIVVSDIDSANVTATLTLSNTAAGSLTTATSNAVTSTFNPATGVWSASGPIADVNVLLASVTFVPAANFNSNFSITTNVSDGALSVGGSKSMTGTAVNDPPIATNLSAAENYTEDTSLNLIDIVVSDADSTTVTATLTLSNSTAGNLTTATSNAVTSTYNAATGVWSASGAIADVNVLLAGVTFVPAANFNANFTIATSVTDGTTAPVTGSKAMTGIAVNDAPVLDASKTPVLATELEDSPAPAGAVGTLVSSLVDFAVPSGQVDNVTDVDAGAVLGVAVVATNTTNGVWFYSIDNGTTWNAVGAVSDSNARLLAADANTRIYFQPSANFNGTIANAITFRAWDQTSGANGGLASATSNGGTTAFSVATDTAALTVTAVNDAPIATNLSAGETYTEDTPLNLIDIVVSDIDSPNVTATLTLSNTAAGSLSTATSNAVTSVYNGGTGVWTASGPIADVNVLLAGVTFNPAANFNSNFSITTNVSDGSLSVSGSKAMTGVAVNDPPTATNLSAAETYTEDTPLNLIDIAVSDIDSASVTATLTLSNTAAGSLSTGTSGAVTSTYNAATGVWSASGAIANVNTLLAGVVFTPAANFNSNFSITTSVSDGVAAPITGSKAMTGVAVNDPPTATNLSAGETYTEDTSLNLIDIVISDVDSNTITATLSLSNTAAGSLTTATSGSVTSTYNSATGVWTASGAISDVNVLLAGVTFVPAANFNSNFSILTSVSDGTAAPVTGTKSMTGIAVNDAPVLDASKIPTFVPESQDSPAPTGAVGTLVSNVVDFASPAGQVDNVTDVDAGALLGIAVIGADTTNGAWFYSTNGGTTWIALATVSDASARLLAADANTRLYFQPNAGFNGTIANGITFRAWDQTSGNANGSAAAAVPNGGVTAFSSASDTASITINAVSSGTMQFSSAAYAGNEGAMVTVTVNRSTSSGSATIHYATSDGTATAGTCGSGNADYTAVSGNLTFNAGETVKTFLVSLCADSISETPAETINLTLTGAVGAQSTAVISIYDAATQFINNTPLNFSGGTAAVSSQITTSGTTFVSGVRVTLFGVTVPNADNIDILLVAPNGAKYVLMGDVGGVNSLSNQTITIEDVATTFMPDSTAITPGVNYRPTTCGGAEHDFAGGAPTGPYSQPGCGPLFTTTLGSVFGNVTPNGTWMLYARDDNGVDPLGATNTISGWGIQLLAPTAAPVSISGQLLTPSGQGIRNANVTIWGGTLPAPVTVKTGTFGYYTFEGLQPGTTYVISVDTKKFVVGNPTRAVTVFDNVAGFDFIAEPRE